MDNAADLLMLSGVVRPCPDCADERIFVPVLEDCDRDACEFCCTSCGAAVLIDPVLEAAVTVRRVA